MYGMNNFAFKRMTSWLVIFWLILAGSEVWAQGHAWPGEFQAWGVPISSRGTVTLADNRSSSGGTMAQGLVAVVNIKDFSKADFDAYCGDISKAGFVLSPDSLRDIMMVYFREGIKVTASFSPELTTVIANNSAAVQKTSVTNTGLVWPPNAGPIPVFSGGSFKETVHMGDGMYAISFVGVSEAAVNDYRAKLRGDGFAKQEDSDTEGYMKVIGGTGYTVGLVRSGSSLQIMTFSTPM